MPVQQHLRVQREPGQPVAAHRPRVRRRRTSIPRRQPAAVGQRGLQQLAADARGPAAPGRTAYVASTTGQLAACSDVATPSSPAASSATQQPPRVGAAAGARVRRDPAARPRSADAALGLGPAGAVGAQVELEERLVGEPLDGRDVLGAHRADQRSRAASAIPSRAMTVGVGEDGRMRVLIAPDKFAGTLTAVEAAEAIADGLAAARPRRRARPGADGRRRAGLRRRAARRRSAASCWRSPCAARTATRCPATVLLVDGTAYVESAQACGLHLTPRRRRPEEATTYGVGELVRGGGRRPAPRRVVVGLGGSAPTTGEPACWPRSAPRRRRGRARPAAPRASPTSTPSTWSRPAGASRASSWWPPPTWTTRCSGCSARPTSSGRRRASPTTGCRRSTRCSSGCAARHRPARSALEQGRRRRRRAGLRAAAARRRPASPGSTSSPTPSACPTGPARADLVITGEGAFDFSCRSGKVPYGVAAVAAEALQPCIALAGQVLVGLAGDARAGRGVGVLAGRPGGGGGQLRATRPGSLADARRARPPAPGRADRAPGRGPVPGNNPSVCDH